MGIEKLYEDLSRTLSALSYITDKNGQLTKNLDWFDDVTYWIDTTQENDEFVKERDWANTVVGNSELLAEVDEYEYGVISIDNVIGLGLTECEHFRALMYVPRLLSAEGGYVFTKVCTRPRNYMLGKLFAGGGQVDYWQEWWRQRTEFYGRLVLNRNEIEEMYDEIFDELGLRLLETKTEKIGWGLFAARFKVTWQ